MKITDILSEDLVLPALAGRSKDDVIEELARAVAERHRDEVDFAKLVQALEDREKLNSTALGEGVAIPHGKLPGLRRVIAAFGRSPLGVDFSSLDGKPTHLFFPRDARQGLQVRAGGVLRRHQQKEEVRRLAVERAEVDAERTAPEGGDHAPQARELAVRDGDPLAERRAVQLLAILQRLDELGAVDFLPVPPRHRAGQLLDDLALRAADEGGEHQVLAQDLGDLHASVLRGCPYRSGSIRP